MKDSHLQAPRQIRDCSFTTGYYSVSSKHEKSHAAADKVIALLGVIAVLVIIWVG